MCCVRLVLPSADLKMHTTDLKIHAYIYIYIYISQCPPSPNEGAVTVSVRASATSVHVTSSQGTPLWGNLCKRIVT